MTNDTNAFEAAMTIWLGIAQEIMETAHNRAGFRFPCPSLSTMYGRRYVRIVREDSSGSRSAHAFVDRTNGDVMKAASWKGPAKNFARGNIYDAARPGVTEYGAHTCY